MKKVVILTVIILTLIVLYPQKTWKTITRIGTTVSSYFYTDTVKREGLVKRNELYPKKHTGNQFAGKEAD